MAGGAVCVDQADVVGERRELGTLGPGWDTSDDPGRGVLLGLEAALDGLHGRYDERGDRVVVVVGVEARQGGGPGRSPGRGRRVRATRGRGWTCRRTEGRR